MSDVLGKITKQQAREYLRTSTNALQEISIDQGEVLAKLSSTSSKTPTLWCIHLGPVKKSDGIPDRVKCHCNGQEQDIYHKIYYCNKLLDSRNKSVMCLPTMAKEFDEDHQTEASMFKLCNINCSHKETKDG